MKIIFMGSPEFAAAHLKKLIDEKRNIIAVITSPDKPKGRGLKLSPTPVKALALKHNLPVYEYQKNWEFIFKLNVDLIVVVAFGKILPQKVFSFPKLGTINVHPSLLPKYRGPSPIETALLNGENKTGQTTFYINENLDSGNIILQKEIKISTDDNRETLTKKLEIFGGEVLSQSIDLITDGKAGRKKQDDNLATYTQKLSALDRRINWEKTNFEIHNQIRAFSPDPGAFTVFNGKQLKTLRSQIDLECQDFNYKNVSVGTIAGIDADGAWIVKTGQGLIKIYEVQLAGKKKVLVSDFSRGYHVEVEQKLMS
jgi:methionyl-tRNA formyltransferase